MTDDEARASRDPIDRFTDLIMRASIRMPFADVVSSIRVMVQLMAEAAGADLGGMLDEMFDTLAAAGRERDMEELVGDAAASFSGATLSAF